MSRQLSVSAIENGTVIDHITPGQALRIVRLLKLAKHKKKVTLGLNLPSDSMGYKDIIKVEEREITEKEAHQIAIFAPRANINIIRRFEVAKKFPVKIQGTVSGFILCPNRTCITNHEPMETLFLVHRFGEAVELTCKYCEKRFTHETV